MTGSLLVQTLTIGADSLETALGYLDCLHGFRARVVETDDGRHQVKITMDGDTDIYAALAAIDRRVAEGSAGDGDLDEALVSEPAGGD